MSSLKGKRILLVGGITHATDLVELAHRNQVFIGVADYTKDSYVKSIADAAHDVDATDVNAVVELCKKEKYDGVICNFCDMLMPYVGEIADKLGVWVPFTQEQIQMSTNKKYFKETCEKYGVQVPKNYRIANKEEIQTADITFPVIVKPVDGSGSRGISVCNNREELVKGYDRAMEFSKCGDVIVEAYLPYDEINITYIIQDGDIQLAAIHDRYFREAESGIVKLPDLYIYPSRYVGLYMEKYNETVIAMLKEIGLKNGSMFLQATVRGEEIYIYEAGMRLNGCKTYQILEVENDYNTFERLMHLSLTGNMGECKTFNPNFKQWYATWNVAAKTGTTVAKVEGAQEILSYPWVIGLIQTYQIGEEIVEGAEGTLRQLVARIHISAPTKEKLLERMRIVNELYHVKDTEGNDIVLEPHDIEELRKSLNYER
ncbi:MAG: ATP-grasp domain-containing protein [Clostridium sp.]|nr:ATP-grasp domain-containing protein [Clostridium sp.]